MLSVQERTLRTLTTAAALALGAIGWAATSRASVLAYARQQTSGYTITGASVGIIQSSTSSSASVFGSGESHAAAIDTPESYIGPAAGRPAENTFSPKGPVNPDYAHGDALVTPLSDNLTTNNVAEIYLTNPGNAAASGTWAMSFPLVLNASGSVTLTFNYSNRLSITNSGSPAGLAQASFSYNFTVQSGASIVFSSSPSVLNDAISNSTSGTLDPTGTGTVTITTGTLAAGTYTGNLTGVENASGSLVPEPASALTLAALGLLAVRGRRRN